MNFTPLPTVDPHKPGQLWNNEDRRKRMKILICGRTGSGKTTLARTLAPLIGAPVFDGDTIRNSYPSHLGFRLHDRVAHAKHMGVLCDAVTASGSHAIASFICPTEETRAVFGADFTICCQDEGDKKYPSDPWVMPYSADIFAHKGKPPRWWAEMAADAIQTTFAPMMPTALFVGRYQPFHAGHKKLIEAGIAKYGQACVAVRDENREWAFSRVKDRIDSMMLEHRGKYVVIPLPNITAVCYGRDVGYAVERIDLDEATHAISASGIRHETFYRDGGRD